jgi:NAD(P)H dehydrogenase (quinone)
VPENALHGSYYGVAVTCPVEVSEDAPKNMPNESDLALGRALGRRVANVAKKLR